MSRTKLKAKLRGRVQAAIKSKIDDKLSKSKVNIKYQAHKDKRYWWAVWAMQYPDKAAEQFTKNCRELVTPKHVACIVEVAEKILRESCE